MKKLLCIIILTLASLSNISAQDKGDFELGANVGVNFSRVNASNNASTNNTTGFNFAAIGEYYFSDTWGIKAKLIYDKKGWGDGFLNDIDTGETVTTDFTLSYLTIPVMANWHFGSTKKWYLNFGLYAGFLLDAKAAKKDVSTIIESTDIGLALGIGYKFPIDDNTKLFVELDGQGGLTNVFSKTLDGSSIRNSRNSINFGVLFDM